MENLLVSEQESFTGLEDEQDEDLEIETMVADYKKRGGTVIGQSAFCFTHTSEILTLLQCLQIGLAF